MAIITAKYPGKCRVCRQGFSAGARIDYAREMGSAHEACVEAYAARGNAAIPASGSSVQVPRPAPAQGRSGTTAPRRLNADGSIEMPFERDALPLLRSLPRARWDAANKRWVASVSDADLPRVLEVAERLKLEVAPELRARCQATEQACEAELDGLYPFQVKGVDHLSRRAKALLADEMGLGKQQPIDAKVLTPEGWRRIGSLEVGDFIIGSNGEATRVTGVFPQGVKPSFRVRFSDGSSVEAGPEHLWTVAYRAGGRRWQELTLTTEQLCTRPTIDMSWPNGRVTLLDLGRTELYLPMLSDAVVFSETSELPLPAYLLGQLIANGSLSDGTPVLTCNEADWADIEKALIFEGVQLGATALYGQARRVLIRGTVAAIRRLELDLHSAEKFIPVAYLRAAPEARVALLQGLMDGDGSISKTGCKLVYHTTSERLAHDVQELVEALGGIASIRGYDRSAEGKPFEYQVRLRLPSWVMPFRVRRKAARYTPGSHALPVRTVESVEYVRDVESVCIAVEAEDRLYATEHCILTHNTVQALRALEADGSAAVLVVCPNSLKLNWCREAEKWAPAYRAEPLSGRAGFRWPAKGELLAVNYDILPAGLLPDDKGAVSMTVPAGLTLIVDEAHYAKNYKAKRTQKLTAIAKGAARVWCLTGTPLTNRPFDLWGVLNAHGMAWDVFGTFKKFIALFGGYQNRHGGWEFAPVPQPEAAERLRRVMLRRLRAEVLPDLPTKTYRTLEVNDIPEALRRKLDACIEVVFDDGRGYEDADALPSFEMFSELRAALAESRIPAVLELAEQYEDASEPLVVFSAHRAPVEALGKREGWAVIMGDTSVADRQAAVDAFQAGKLKGIALTIGAGSTGLTLTRASHVVFVDLDWVPANNAQAEDRVCRIGQTAGSVVITRMVSSHPLDRHVHELLEQKIALAFGAVDAEASYTGPKATRAGAAAAEPVVAEELREAVHAALRVLSGMCDGARLEDGMGFNRMDSAFGKSLAARPVLTARQVLSARRMVWKYKRQLPAGIVETLAKFAA